MTESQQFIETLTQEYIENHIRKQERDELIAENNIEKRDIKGYHGRELLELLQNADDAYQKSINLGKKPECDLIVEIKYINNVLTVANTGTFFDKDGMKAIVQGNNSPKKGKYIGNKGTGFRSILNWAHDVKIYSGDFAVEFSKEIATEFLNQIKHEPQIEKQIKKDSNLYIPMLAVPKNIEHTLPKEYTTIQIKVNQGKQNDDYSVEKQLNGIDLRILLFLPNVSKISIETDSISILYERHIRKERQKKVVYLRKYVNNIVEIEEQFALFEKTIHKKIMEDDVWKDIQLAIGVPYQTLSGTNHVYSYFPLLETDSPFNCVLHATYVLGDHRNNINTTDVNKKIIQEQLSFLLEVARQYVKEGDFKKAYQILIPSNYTTRDWHFTSAYSKFNLEEYYIDLLRYEKLFQTVNEKVISINDNPKYIDGPFPKVFSKEPFEKLLKWSDDANLSQLIRLISRRVSVDLSFTENELCECINLSSEIWTVPQQVDVFIWWRNTGYQNSLPHLLKTQQNNWIRFNDECYFLEGDFDSVELPKWVRVPAIREDYQKSLLIKSRKDVPGIITLQKDPDTGQKRSIARTISQNNVFPNVNFKYRDRSNIIPAINSSVNTYKKSILFVKWLWKYYRTSAEEQLAIDYTRISLKFPSNKGKIVDSHSLYFGKEYGNFLSEYIFGNTYSEIPAPITFSIKKDDEVEFQEFLRSFGVKDFPKIEITNIPDISLDYDMTIKQQICTSGVDSSYVKNLKYKLPYINDLKNLLNILPFDKIIKWLIDDVDLASQLAFPYCSSKAVITFRSDYRFNERRYTGKVPNYILWLFNEMPWVVIGGKRYAPKQILKGYDSKNNQKFETVIPVMTVQIIEELAKKLNVLYDQVVIAIDKLAFAEKITDLSSDAFYGLMLTLQESSNPQNMEMSRAIYRIVEQPAFNKIFEQSINKDIFLKQKKGKLLVKYQGKIQFYPASESFLPSTKIIDKKNFPIVEKGQRTNNSNFIKLFGCKEYDIDASVIKGSEVISSINGQFQNYFSIFQKYARAYGERNENIEKIASRLKIVLVDKIDVLENNIRVTISENYSLIKDSTSTWFLVCKDNHLNINSLSEQIESIYANIANTSGFDAGKVGELFRAESKELREFLIKKEFGSLEVIDDKVYKNAIRQNFIETIKAINPSIDLGDLQIDFNDFNDWTNCTKIIELLSKLSIDIDDLEKAGFVYTINLKDYYAHSLEAFVRKEFEHFKDVEYCKALADKKLQNNFIDTIDAFEAYPRNVDIINSVSYNYEKDMIAEFGEWRNFNYDKSAKKEYDLNYEKMNPDRLYEDIIANDKNVQRMFYFGLGDEFNDWIKGQQAAESSANTANQKDKYFQFRNVVPKKIDVSYSNGKNDDSEVHKFSKHKGIYTLTMSTKKEANLKEIGNCGELLIYNLLCKQFGTDNVFPRSEAYVDLGIIKPGQAVSGDYDISYKDQTGDEIFVEVKTGHENIFFMTPGELQFAKRHPDSYRVYFVSDIKSEFPKYIVLPCKFWEDTHYRISEIVEKIEITF